jgi:hypothetical protein
MADRIKQGIGDIAGKVMHGKVDLEPLDFTQMNHELIGAINRTAIKPGYTGANPLKDAMHELMMNLREKGKTLDPGDVEDWLDNNVVMIVRKYQTAHKD